MPYKFERFEIDIRMKYEKSVTTFYIEAIDLTSSKLYSNSYCTNDINYDVDDLYDLLKDNFVNNKKNKIVIKLKNNNLLIDIVPDKSNPSLIINLILHPKINELNKFEDSESDELEVQNEANNIIVYNESFEDIYKRVKEMPNYYVLEYKLKGLAKIGEKRCAINDITKHFVKVLDNKVFSSFNENMKSSSNYNKFVDINISDLIEESKNNEKIYKIIELIIERVDKLY